MAQIGITKLLDGARNAVFHVTIEGDGSGELTDNVIIDPTTDFDPALPASPAMSVEELWYDLSGFNAWLEFEYLTSDTPVWSMSGDQFAHLCFNDIGPLKDRSPDADGTGKLKLSTSGLGDGEHGTFVIKVRKG